MRPDAVPVPFVIQIDVEGADADELDRLTRQLRNDVQDLDVGSVEFQRAGVAPPGSKAGDPITLGVVVGVVSLGVMEGVAKKFGEYLIDWMIGKGMVKRLRIQIAGKTFELPQKARGMTGPEKTEFIESFQDAVKIKPDDKKGQSG